MHVTQKPKSRVARLDTAPSIRTNCAAVNLLKVTFLQNAVNSLGEGARTPEPVRYAEVLASDGFPDLPAFLDRRRANAGERS